ncbi:hypothetical protein V1264_010844 [Littorina saxatilis]|uniref:Paired domain-containing protein n=1 Tax=Littorina saxatilis TaxID=31220 RepID=A0AAN9BRC2_9CAEN
MPPRRKLSDLDRGRAIGWLQDGVAARQVAQRLAVAPSVIIRLKQRFHATGRVQERQRSGRPRVTTQREDRFIQRQAMQQRMATANNIMQRQGGDVAQSVARWICIQLAAVSVSSSPRSARDLFLRVNFVCRLSSVSEHPRVYTQAQDQVRTKKIL